MIAVEPALHLAALQVQQAQATEAHRIQPRSKGLVVEALERGVRRRFGGLGVYGYDGPGAVYPTESDPLGWGQQARLQASDMGGPVSADNFGQSVALSADGATALVGASYKANGDKAGNGAAYVFVRTPKGWDQQAKFVPDVVAGYQNFGQSVALSSDGNIAFVGAPDDFQKGAGYVFARSGNSWAEQARFEADDGQNNDSFGRSVSLSSDGNTALVGAWRRSDGELRGNGAAYVFQRSGDSWSQQAKIVADDRSYYRYFGWSVAIAGDGNTALVGDYDQTTPADHTGAAYVFTRTASGWSQQTKVFGDSTDVFLHFGQSVSLSSDGNTALIGAYSYFSGGFAYVLARTGSTWSQQAKLVKDEQSASSFGSSVTLSSNGLIALIGAPRDSGGGAAQSGASYLFVRKDDGWSQPTQLVADDTASEDFFGNAVALSADGSTALVGAARKSDQGQVQNGAAYVFTPGKGTGEACAAGAECASSFCADGVCCTTACAGTDDCQACSVAAGAAANGTCGPSTGNTCADDDACTQTDVCQAGTCMGSNPLICTASDACHTAGSCDPATGVCSNPVRADGSACSDDNACTKDDACRSGVCVPGAPPVCVPGECQEGGSCDESSGVCVFTNHPDGTPCSTGMCASGTCVSGGSGGEAGASGVGGEGSTSGVGGVGGAAGSASGGRGQGGEGGISGEGGSAGQAGEGPSGSGSAGDTSGSGISGSSGQNTASMSGHSGHGGPAGKGGAGNSGTGSAGRAGATSADAPSRDDGACACKTAGSGRSRHAPALALLAFGLLAARRRRG